MLTTLPLLENSDDFVFDNQMLAQCVHFGFRIGEVSCPTKYFEEASSINFGRSVKYGLGVVRNRAPVRASNAGALRTSASSAQRGGVSSRDCLRITCEARPSGQRRSRCARRPQLLKTFQRVPN